ncbi:uncharacterized protein LOC130736723 [Lotus japonicus]|uniref:uncharacterized protein LOC130736723 n=1 Tax=Lotus japonicus TaxID=34305 RepID=UPI0025861A0D|nr:uncharacterized protein LOC130736723 [Lotus japonicus]
MKMISWNCRGLGTPRAVGALRKLITMERPDLVFLMETRKKAFEIQKTKMPSGLVHSIGVDCNGEGKSRGGGLACYWSSSLDVNIISLSSNHIQMEVTTTIIDSKMVVTGIYGHPEAPQKWRTWELIKKLTPDPEVPWLCLGDFNEVLKSSEKTGGNPINFVGAQAFQEAMDFCGLRDMGFSGFQFTWSNMRPTPNTIQERLDRALVNECWTEHWPHTHVSHLDRFNSDHNPIYVIFSKAKRQKKKKIRLYRFEEMWLQEEDCRHVIHHSWPRGGRNITSKLGNVGANLTEWAEATFGNIQKRIKSQLGIIKRIQAAEQTEENLKKGKEAEKELENLLKL